MIVPAVACVLALSAAAEPVPPPRAVADDPFRSVAWVRAEGDTAGTGFVVDRDRNWLVTARHVVADRKTVDVFFPWRRGGDLVTERAEYLANRDALRRLGLLVTGKVVRTSDAKDLAVVELPSLPDGVRAVRYPDHRTDPNGPFRVVGNRNDLPTLWNVAAGPVRVVGPLADGYPWRGRVLAKGASVLVGQWSTEEGDSGGPVFNRDGEVVGVVTALRRGCPSAAVAVCWPEVDHCLALRSPDPDLPNPLPDPQRATPRPPCGFLTHATAWVRPSATDYRRAAVLIDRDRGFFLTNARGLGDDDRVPLALWEDGDHRPPARGNCGAVRVVARDGRRDLALLKLSGVGDDTAAPDGAFALPLAKSPPAPGDPVHAMSHPSGLEFGWVYAAGAVRQRGRVALGGDDPADGVNALVLQLPTQGRSPGGPVINDAGEVVGVLAAKDGPLGQVGYAASVDEIARFLDVARTDHAPRTWDGAVARLFHRVRAARETAAAGLVEQAKTADDDRTAAELCEKARLVAPWSAAAGVYRSELYVRAFRPADAAAVLDRLLERGCRDENLILERVVLSHAAADFRRTRGLAETFIELHGTGTVDLFLTDALFRLGEDDKAAAAFARFNHGQPPALGPTCGRLVEHADVIAARHPAAPGKAADYLRRVLDAVHAAAGEATRAELAPVLEKVAAKTDAERLAVLRAFVEKRAGR